MHTMHHLSHSTAFSFLGCEIYWQQRVHIGRVGNSCEQWVKIVRIRENWGLWIEQRSGFPQIIMGSLPSVLENCISFYNSVYLRKYLKMSQVWQKLHHLEVKFRGEYPQITLILLWPIKGTKPDFCHTFVNCDFITTVFGKYV